MDFTQNLSSALAIQVSAHTLGVLNTHTLQTMEQWAAFSAVALREQLGVKCLAQGHLSNFLQLL